MLIAILNRHCAAWLLLCSLPGFVIAQTKPALGLVEQLATTNPPATIRGKPPDEEATWSKFDFKEGARLDGVVKQVIQHSEKLWPELVAHLGDDRYCKTVGIDAGFPRNKSIGDVCQLLIGETLSEPYYRHMLGTKETYHKFRIPDFAKDKPKLREWCLARKDRKLFELQIEACELIIAGQKDSDFKTAIAKEIEGLKKSQMAIPFPVSF